MHGEYGEMYITGGTANFTAANAGAELGSTVGWTAGADQHGNAAVAGSTSTGRLTLSPGTYQVTLEATIEGNHSSGFSGDFAGVVTAAIHSGGTLVAGSKTKCQTITEGLPMPVSVTKIVEITQASQDAATPTNYVSGYLYGGDASGNDVVVTEARISAIRLN